MRICDAKLYKSIKTKKAKVNKNFGPKQKTPCDLTF